MQSGIFSTLLSLLGKISPIKVEYCFSSRNVMRKLSFLGQSYFSPIFRFLPSENVLPPKQSPTPYLPIQCYWEAHTFPFSFFITIHIHGPRHSSWAVRKNPHCSVAQCHSLFTALTKGWVGRNQKIATERKYWRVTPTLWYSSCRLLLLY